MTKLERFNKFLALVMARISDIQIKYKNESLFMKILGWISFFNPKFMTNYTTVVGKTIYFPTKDFLTEDMATSATIILAHETRHMEDLSKYTRFIYWLMYFFPAILAPLMLLFLLLPISYAISIPLSVILFLGCLAPLPAPGRKHFEFRGYAVNLFMYNELYKEKNYNLETRRIFLTEKATAINDIFTGSGYYFMWPFGIESQLKETVDKVLNDELVQDEFFATLRKDLAASKL